jgi:hypothetical protein
VHDCTHDWHAFFHGQPDDQIHVLFYTDVERCCNCHGHQVCKCICDSRGWNLEELSRPQAVRKSRTSRLAIIQCSGLSFVIRTISDTRSADLVVQHEGIDIMVISVPKAMDGISPELSDTRNIQLRYWVLTRYESFRDVGYQILNGAHSESHLAW